MNSYTSFMLGILLGIVSALLPAMLPQEQGRSTTVIDVPLEHPAASGTCAHTGLLTDPAIAAGWLVEVTPYLPDELQRPGVIVAAAVCRECGQVLSTYQAGDGYFSNFPAASPEYGTAARDQAVKLLVTDWYVGATMDDWTQAAHTLDADAVFPALSDYGRVLLIDTAGRTSEVARWRIPTDGTLVVLQGGGNELK